MQCSLRVVFWFTLTNLESASYVYLTYDGVLEEMEGLASRFPDCVTVFDALSRWPELASFSTESLDCGTSRCKFLVAEIGNISSPHQVFMSGEVHGDERVGPQALLETVRLLCDGSLGPLPQDRSVIAVPLANPYGYFRNVREENGRDANRDFPYDQEPGACLQTVTARVIHRLFYHYKRIESGITFHGGIASISYPWGSFAHKGELAPDHTSLAAISSELQRVGGRNTYEVGAMNDIVYPVRGGMEDWAYATGFESSVRCTPSTFGGYDLSYASGVSLPAASLFLVEISHEKSPPVSALGSSSELWATDDAITLSPVPRAVRIALSTIAMVRPTVVFIPMFIGDVIPLAASGCITATASTSVTCEGAATVVTTTQLACKDSILFQKQNIQMRDGCDASVSIKFDDGVIGTEPNGKLSYTRDRAASIAGSVEEGRCVHLGANMNVCVSRSKLLVHPNLIHFSPNVTITDKSSGVRAYVLHVSDLLTDLSNTIDFTNELTITLESGAELAYTGTLTATVPTASQSQPVNKLILLIILALPLGILTIYVVRLWRRPKIPPGSEPIQQEASITPMKV